MAFDLLWISVAFALGLGARQLGLPPLIGFLAAGFVLKAMGATSSETLQEFADFGVTLLLFSIGLKLNLRTLLRPEVYAVATGHMLVTVLVFAVSFYALGIAGISLFAGASFAVAILIAFALSFSSTVFAVKVLEEKGEMASRHGRVAIGILIMQDVVAVLFLAASTGKLPSPWALLLLGLIPLRPVLVWLMNRAGHGELLILLGLLLAIGGAEGFELVNMKGDLGALIIGILIASHPKAGELAHSLLGFKDLFLVGFFLTIGLKGAPTLEAVGLAALLGVLLPLKVLLFFWLLTRFRLRARASLLASLSLANYSEFGLIVGAIAVGSGWLSPDWLVVIAIALAISFVVAAPINGAAHSLYGRYRQRLRRFETVTCLPEDQPIDVGDASIIVFGMGRVGTGAYDAMRERYGATVTGIDFDPVTVEEHTEKGRNVLVGDGTDPDFWARIQLREQKLDLVMLTMPNHTENILVAQHARERGFKGRIAATAKFPEEIQHLRDAGVEAAFNIYAEAGAGFADHVCAELKPG